MTTDQPPPLTRREQQREHTREEIKALARAQMAKDGTAGISLRGIAGEMGLTVTALYRYFASRDDLITALILDGFNAQADALEAAIARRAPDDFSGQLYDALITYRTWAVDHWTDYQLLYGNPIPGYEAPADQTVPAASRILIAMVRILVLAHQAGKLHLSPDYQDIPPHIAAHMAQIPGAEGVPPQVIYLGVVGWTRIHGMITLELYDHTPPVTGDPAEFYRHEVLALMRSAGM